MSDTIANGGVAQEESPAAESRLVATLANLTAASAGATRVAERELLGFRIHGQSFALEARAVTSVVIPDKITDLPLSAPHVRGVFSHYGRVVAIVDLAVMGGHEPIRDYKRLLLVTSGETECAVPVEEVLGFLRVPADQIEPPSQQLSSRPYIVGQMMHEDSVLYVMEAAQFIEAAKVDKGGGG